MMDKTKYSGKVPSVKTKRKKEKDLNIEAFSDLSAVEDFLKEEKATSEELEKVLVRRATINEVIRNVKAESPDFAKINARLLKKFIRLYFEEIVRIVAVEERPVQITGFGTFFLKKRKTFYSKIARKDVQQYWIAFRSSRLVKKIVNQYTEHDKTKKL